MVAATPQNAFDEAAQQQTHLLSTVGLLGLLGEMIRRRRAKNPVAAQSVSWMDGIFFNRPPAAGGAPGTAAPPKARPVLDALKSLFTTFINQAGPSLMPLLLNLLTGFLKKAGTPAPSVAPASVERISPVGLIAAAQAESNKQLSQASDDALIGSFASLYQQHTGIVAESANPALDTIIGFIQQILSLLGPDVETWVVDLVTQIFSKVLPAA